MTKTNSMLGYGEDGYACQQQKEKSDSQKSSIPEYISLLKIFRHFFFLLGVGTSKKLHLTGLTIKYLHMRKKKGNKTS